MNIGSNHYDFVIAGSGFAGSILAMCLTRCGYNVCLLEKEKHPRFAIGESSTPIADMILRDLASEYHLSFLNEISRYGDWQRTHPEIICGLKRGFSYYQHVKNESFKRDMKHHKDLLVAASIDDENSDTNWLRSDVDHFLVRKAIELGVSYRENSKIIRLERDHQKKSWQVHLKIKGDEKPLSAAWIIDATGSSAFSGEFFNTSVTSDPFYTHSRAIFTHMDGVCHWNDYLQQIGHHTSDYPYNPDHSALHHMIDEGWVWMLRFNNDLLSCGLLIDESSCLDLKESSPSDIWKKTIHSYPSLKNIFSTAGLSEHPGHFIQSGRLQRLLSKSFGDGWIALNHTAGFVDPMHSTGIAHSLKGVEDIMSIFHDRSKSDKEIEIKLEKLHQITRKEILMIDKLVSMCYKSRSDFDLFHASVMIYFIATVQYEQRRLKGDKPEAFLCAIDPQIEELVSDLHREIISLDLHGEQSAVQPFIERVKERIEPFNSAGLMDKTKKNMYRHTAVTL